MSTSLIYIFPTLHTPSTQERHSNVHYIFPAISVRAAANGTKPEANRPEPNNANNFNLQAHNDPMPDFDVEESYETFNLNRNKTFSSKPILTDINTEEDVFNL